MRTVTYLGRGDVFYVGTAQGMTADRRFLAGTPVEVSDQDAERLLRDFPDRFTAEPAREDPTPAPTAATASEAPEADSTDPEEG